MLMIAHAKLTFRCVCLLRAIDVIVGLPFLGMQIEDSAVSCLRGKVSALTQDSPGYHVARRVHNANIDAFPMAIVEVESTLDVVHSLHCAETHATAVRIRSGGHNLAGWSTCDDCIVLDMRRMNSVKLEPDNTTVIAAGADFNQIAEALTPLGRQVVHGTCNTVGIAGYTLGGGWGLMSRQHGLSIDNLHTIELVLPNGTITQASASTNVDLFWALRGAGGGNFGIVTSFTLGTHELHDAVLFIQLVWNASAAPKAMAALHVAMAENVVPHEFGFLVMFVQRHAGGQVLSEMALLGVHDGDRQEIVDLLAAIGGNTTQKTSVELVTPASAAMRFQDFEDSFMLAPHGNGAPKEAKRSGFLSRGLTSQAVQELTGILMESMRMSPTSMSSMYFESWGGKIDHTGVMDTAFVHRRFSFDLSMVAMWLDPADEKHCRSWLASVHEVVTPFLSGEVYQNYMDVELKGYRESYYGIHAERLWHLRRDIDPLGLLLFNHSA